MKYVGEIYCSRRDKRLRVAGLKLFQTKQVEKGTIITKLLCQRKGALEKTELTAFITVLATCAQRKGCSPGSPLNKERKV